MEPAVEGRRIAGSSWAGKFTTGMMYPLRGFKLLLSHKTLLGLVLLSGLISAGLIMGLFVGAFLSTTPLVTWIFDQQGWFFYLLWVAGFLILLLLALLLFQILNPIVTGDISERLSAKTEHLFHYVHPFGDKGISLWTTVKDSLSPLPLAIALFAGLILLNFIPLIGQILTLVIGSIISLRTITREMLEIPMNRRGLSGKTVLSHYKAQRPVWMGFGLIATPLVMIPLLNLVGIPASIIGATMLYMSLETAGLTPREPS